MGRRHGPGHALFVYMRDPDGHRFELYYECERYVPPPELRPALKNVPGRYSGRGCAVKRLILQDFAKERERGQRPRLQGRPSFCHSYVGWRRGARNDDARDSVCWIALSSSQ